MQKHLKYLWYYLIIFLLAFGLKYHYSRAESEQLGWILSPTAGMVEILSGISFEREIGEGYINYEHSLIIASSCAGVNFLIAAFCMAGFSFLYLFHRAQLRVFWILASLIGSYLLTILVNAVRILLGMSLYQANFALAWCSPEQIHRLEGVVIYFFFLCIYYLLLQKSFDAIRRVRNQDYGIFVKIFLPLFWYLCIVLLVPYINQAYRKEFYFSFEHSLSVIAACLVVFVFLNAVKICYRKLLKVDKVERLS